VLNGRLVSAVSAAPRQLGASWGVPRGKPQAPIPARPLWSGLVRVDERRRPRLCRRRGLRLLSRPSIRSRRGPPCTAVLAFAPRVTSARCFGASRELRVRWGQATSPDPADGAEGSGLVRVSRRFVCRPFGADLDAVVPGNTPPTRSRDESRRPPRGHRLDAPRMAGHCARKPRHRERGTPTESGPATSDIA
jgi:hypothetical protein